MVDNGYFFIRDSAYELQSFLLTPYDNAVHGTAEDDYKYFHSSSCISVECAFGEIDLRWGILWKPLKFSLTMNCPIIDACMRLKKFIVEHRCDDTSGMDAVDVDIFNDDAQQYFAVHPNEEQGVFGGEADVQRSENGNVFSGGQPTLTEVNSRDVGKKWRDKHRNEIAQRQLAWPVSNWYRCNNRSVEDEYNF